MSESMPFIEVNATDAALPSGKLAMLTAVAAATKMIPIPFVPGRLSESVRGAIVHSVASRSGLALTTDARSILANPDSTERASVRKAAEFIVVHVLRRLRPLGVVSIALEAFEVYALGFLLDRYFRQYRKSSSIRIHADEATHIRRMIDRAVFRALSPTLRPRLQESNQGIEDFRDEFTRFIDSILLTGAALPNYIESRLSSALDEIVQNDARKTDAA